MQQNKTFFFAIIGLAILALIGMFVGAYLFLGDSLDLSVSQPVIAIRVVAAPALKPWVDQAAQQFNRQNGNTQVEIIAADSLIPESLFTSNPQASPPAAWLAEATFVIELARKSGLAFEDPRSVAGSGLAWGAFNNRQDEFVQQYGELSWSAIHQRAVEPDSSLRVVVASPRNSAEGLAALISAAAAQANTQTLTNAQARQAEDWLTDTLKESARSSLTLGPNPAEALATRGVSIGDAGLLSLASWRSAGLQNRPDFTITPAQFNVRLDYPFTIWAGSQATPAGKQAAAAFRDFLLSEAQQSTLPNFFFERAGTATPAVQVDGDAALTLLRWADRELR
ncbi:MAG: substrate-binding domain-containing protein [Chloroflexota bacterium]